jgi:hypothetical protein
MVDNNYTAAMLLPPGYADPSLRWPLGYWLITYHSYLRMRDRRRWMLENKDKPLQLRLLVEKGLDFVA